MSSQPRLPFPGRSVVYSPVNQERAVATPDLNSDKFLELERTSNDDVYHHLGSLVSLYPGLLEEYVVTNVSSENISRWLTKRKTYEARSSGIDSSVTKPVANSCTAQDVSYKIIMD